jgi:hypothetical protein
MDTSDSVQLQLTRGRTKNSVNAIYQGFRYNRGAKPTNSQLWQSVLRNCKGRMVTVDGTQEHNHSPDLADCEEKTIIHQGDRCHNKNTCLYPISQSAIKLHRVECVGPYEIVARLNF